MLDPEIVQIAAVFVAALSVGGVVYVLVMPFLSGERRRSQRIASVSERRTRKGGSARPAVPEALHTRKQQVQDTLKELEARQKSKKKASLRVRLRRAGLNVPTRSFYIASAICGLAVFAVVFVTGSSPVVSLLAGMAAGLGFPRWLLGYMTKRRQRRFLNEFANSIDVIVRGVKTGLPLNDCLKIIAQEAPEPVKSEFVDIVEQQSVGVPLMQAFERVLNRMPLPEVNFFAIVVAIQQQTGGNLSEALGNLAQVLRDRQRLNNKVSAYSAEAKASAAIVGALPPAVMLLVYITTPDYIELLWTDQLGKMMLAASAVWMLMGVLVMRKMINFDY